MRLNEREILGGTLKAGNNETPVVLQERDDKIVVSKGCSTLVKFEISAESARVMARNLQRLARRIEARAASAIEARSGETTEIGAAEGESAVPKDDAHA